jgi:hypothetical protein
MGQFSPLPRRLLAKIATSSGIGERRTVMPTTATLQLDPDRGWFVIQTNENKKPERIGPFLSIKMAWTWSTKTMPLEFNKVDLMNRRKAL